ncbi:glycosyltransferase, partial [Candidatus Marsarchaeota archaeon]|nr:glycosyltransferase [Candidatus Marsarchaeota archaeon]
MKKYSKKISVIIAAYNRKNFLYDAVKSAIDQTIDKKLYEIIIIKNFEDRKIDRLIKNSNISIKQILLKSKLIYYPNGLLISKALKKSNGEIIVFLEDDDIFEKNKLQQVLKIFVSF